MQQNFIAQVLDVKPLKELLVRHGFDLEVP